MLPKTDDAIKLYQEAQARFEKLGDDVWVGRCYYLMGEHSGFSGDFKKQTEYLEKAIPYFDKAGDKGSLRQSYDLLGLIYMTILEEGREIYAA